MNTAEERIADALKVAYQHGDTDGAHHKAWVIDQMVAALTGEGYEAWVADFIDGGTDGLDVFEWDKGIAP